jgi:hypothetical protein
MNWATVPKAAIHEDSNAGVLEGYVRLTAKVRNRAAMSPKAHPTSVEFAAEPDFRDRVSPGLSLHASTSCWW